MVYLLLLGALALASCQPDPSGPANQGPYGRIETFAGTGVAGKGDDTPRLHQAQLYLPQDLTLGPDGQFYILDWNNHRIRVTASGRLQTLIGTGELGDAPAGPALEIGLNHPTHIAFDSLGRLILSAWHNSKILRYDFSSGLIEAICGTGERAYGGDGGPADQALINLPSSTAFDLSGRMYISDQENQRVRRVDMDGTISTVIGTGVAGFSGDGGLATEAQIYAPQGQAAPPTSRIAADQQGHIYLADTFNNRIRRLSPDGVITTIAGNGVFPPDASLQARSSAPALDVSLHWPCDVAPDRAGNLFIADTFNNCVRRLGTDGLLTTVAGQCGKPGDTGDGGHPLQALLNRPYGIEVDLEGNLYIADTRNHRIRVVHK
ncbi:MAG: hypothetical protein GKR89_16590 [Candidatus Latescibacteria bacterium]|nr:hypothetical protein [Candidatus Latescibacterota bacterium]